jgi:hypothetical protein
VIRGKIYRALMKLAHKYHWHYAPPSYPDGDTHLCCQWCGFRQTIKRRGDVLLDVNGATDAPSSERIRR